MSIICDKLFHQIDHLYSSFNPAHFVIGITAFNQGIQHLSDLAINYMLKDDYGLSPAMMGMYLSYTTLPWMIKPLWGLITDSKPLLGYRRKSYIMLFGLMNALGWFLLSKYSQQGLVVVLLLLFLIQLSVCFVNVVGEAILVEVAALAQRDQTTPNFQHGASKNVSIFFGVRACGALLSAYSSGALLHYFTYQQIFLMTSIFPTILVLASLCYVEQPVAVNLEQGGRQYSTSECLRDFWKFFKNPLIYQPVMLIFAFMMAPSSSTIMFFFYTEVLGFDPKFLGQLKFMYAVASISGVLIYNRYLKDVSFAKIFLVTSFIYYLCYQSIIILVTRKNVEWGINDKIFCIGDQVMLQFVGELNIMPILVLACRMCPKHIEATMYAMLMSTLNFGSLLGSWLGALLLIIMKINQNDYSRLWLFIAITGIFILLPLPWLYVVREDEILKQREKTLEQQESSEQAQTTSTREQKEENVPLLEERE